MQCLIQIEGGSATDNIMISKALCRILDFSLKIIQLFRQKRNKSITRPVMGYENDNKIIKRTNDWRKKMKNLDVLVAVLLVVGGLNWGLVGLANFDLVASIFGSGASVSRLVYALVGLSAIYQVIQWKAIQRRWIPASN